jgi:hypothetical protein
VNENQFAFAVPDIDSVNHIVIFLTGAVPLPNDFAAAIYIGWPGPEMTWQYLGFIANQKPSAIFKLGRARPKESVTTPFGTSMFTPHSTAAQIGISLEPLQQILQMTPVSHSTPSAQDSFSLMASRMLENFSEFAASYSMTQAQMMPMPSEAFIPVSVLNEWAVRFEKRIKEDPNFWKS